MVDMNHEPEASSALLVGNNIVSQNAAWDFGGDTPSYFEEHVSKSVPYYNDGHKLIISISDFFVKSNSICYELGCSTGLLTRNLASHHLSSVKWVGIDVEPNMIAMAKEYLATKAPSLLNVEYITDDILIYPFESSDFMVAYYTIQFVPPYIRQDIYNRIYQSLNWGGAFLLFEKVRAPDARFQDIASSLYVEYKLSQGYTPSEVIAKSRSLKGVLEPFSTAGNLDMLMRAGFTDIMTVFKHVCFEGFFCIK